MTLTKTDLHAILKQLDCNKRVTIHMMANSDNGKITTVGYYLMPKGIGIDSMRLNRRIGEHQAQFKERIRVRSAKLDKWLNQYFRNLI